MDIFSGGVEYAKVDVVSHLAQWTACRREGRNEELGQGCLFRLGLHFKEYFHSFIYRLKSSSEQEVVMEGIRNQEQSCQEKNCLPIGWRMDMEGISYCIIIQESQQTELIFGGNSGTGDCVNFLSAA